MRAEKRPKGLPWAGWAAGGRGAAVVLGQGPSLSPLLFIPDLARRREVCVLIF